MPLFRNTWDNQPVREPEPLPPTRPQKRSGFFGSRRSVDDSPTRRSVDNTSTRRTDTYTNTNTRYSPTNTSYGGFFSRGRSSDTSSDRSFDRSSGQESSIRAARQKIADAENAENNADDALRQARKAVREAKAHILILENEAREE